MDDSELASILAAHETRAVGYYNSEIADEQARALNYYYGRMDDLPVMDGCSAVVDHSVAVTIDNALAAVLKPFVSADRLVSFDPRGRIRPTLHQPSQGFGWLPSHRTDGEELKR